MSWFIELTLSPASMVVIGTDPIKLGYELTNIQLEYEAVKDVGLAKEARSNYLNGKHFMFDHVTHHKTITVNKGSAQIINESMKVPCRSIKGLLLLFSEPYAGGTRQPKKFFNPNITSLQVSVNGVFNKVYSQGMEERDMWDKVKSHFGEYAGI